MTTSPSQTTPKGKGGKSERLNRLGTALRENLRKRKNQIQEREKSRLPKGVNPKE